METIRVNGARARGLALARADGALNFTGFFGLPGAGDQADPGCAGLFFLDADSGRYEGARWLPERIDAENGALRLTLRTADGAFAVKMDLGADGETGVVRWRTSLENRSGAERVIYAALPRIPLQGGGYRLYGQYSAWCAENQGGWTELRAGCLELGDSNGCSTESAAPFACVESAATGLAAAIHVVPIGDWVIRARRVAGHRTSCTVLEAGLSDASLRLRAAAGETLELPELALCGFEGAAENCCEPFERWLLGRYGREELPELVYNTWFLDFDVLEPARLRRQAELAREAGCRVFVVDAGWFGHGLDWENQVGCWDECAGQAFGGRMRDFADFVRSLGMEFGLWMEPERACPGTRVCREHPDWFLKADAVIFDLSLEAVQDYLAGQVKRLADGYGLRWMKFDYNTNMRRDLTGGGFYRYSLGERRLLARIRAENPGCTFEGCAGGGRRTDFANVMTFYHGHFVSDTVNPLEILRMRQNAAPRLLPAYTGSWLVLHETPFAVSSYTDHDYRARRKTFACGDAWWNLAVDVKPSFALAVCLLGEWGLSGDLASLSEETRAGIRAGAAFYAAHRRFLAQSLCRPLTALQPLDDHTGWTALQYENVRGEGSLLFLFRLVDDADTFLAFPKGLLPDGRYRVRLDGEELGVRTGAALMRDGEAVRCADRYEARILELIPAEADSKYEKSGKGE